MAVEKKQKHTRKPPLQPSLQDKFDHLRRLILEAESAVVAFSGGVDSSLLLKTCSELLAEKVLAVTARSEAFPSRELEEAKNLAKEIGVRHVIIDSEELEVPGFSDNPPERCFLCKTELFTKIKEIALLHGMGWVFDGSNADDVNDFRPGRAAARQLGVRTPLEEAGLGKAEIRNLSEMLGLPTWNKPAFACLSSRFPYHTRITRQALKQVEMAETYLWELGMRVFRVRHHGNIARIELGEAEMRLFWKARYREELVKQFKSLGYKYVTLDLEGYRTGSMNETLSTGQREKVYMRKEKAQASDG